MERVDARQGFLGMAAGLLLLVAVACGAEAPTATPAQVAVAEPKAGGTLVVATTAVPVSLDVRNVTERESEMQAGPPMDLLVREGPDGQMKPELALSWEMAPDGKRVTFKLRKDVKFHDGTSFNADSVAFNIRQQTDKDHPQFNLGAWGSIRAAALSFNFGGQVEKVDDSTVVFSLGKALPDPIPHFTVGWTAQASPAAVQKLGKDYASQPVGTGPWKFVRFVRGEEVVYERNGEYWGGAPLLDRVVYVPIPEAQNRLAALKTGRVQLAYDLPVAAIPDLSKGPQFAVQRQPTRHNWVLFMSQKFEPFKDLGVRRAVAHAIDKEAIVRDVLKGTGEVAYGPLGSANPLWDEPNVRTYEYRPPKAKDLLWEARYPDGFEVAFHCPESGPGMQVPIPLCTTIQAQLAAVGIRANLRPREYAGYAADYYRGRLEPGLFAGAQVASWSDPDSLTCLPWTKKSWPDPEKGQLGMNMSFYVNDEVEQLCEKGQEPIPYAERKKVYSDIQKLLAAEVPGIIIDHEIVHVVSSAKVKGLEMPGAVFFLRFLDAYLAD